MMKAVPNRYMWSKISQNMKSTYVKVSPATNLQPSMYASSCFNCGFNVLLQYSSRLSKGVLKMELKTNIKHLEFTWMERSTVQGKTRSSSLKHSLGYKTLHVFSSCDTKAAWCTRPSKVKLEISPSKILPNP